jgi:DNA-3-methyladenine glycosylase I
VGEFLMSIGYLPGAHVERCPVYRRILTRRPPWALVPKPRARAARGKQ